MSVDNVEDGMRNVPAAAEIAKYKAKDEGR
jgi:hypothetical protein